MVQLNSGWQILVELDWYEFLRLFLSSQIYVDLFHRRLTRGMTAVELKLLVLKRKESSLACVSTLLFNKETMEKYMWTLKDWSHEKTCQAWT
jgi:hypothetical protein